MKRKIEKYLKSKEKSVYSNLDRVFELYLKGDIKKLLSNYVGIGIYPTINKLGKTIQLQYHYHNIYATIDFFEDKYHAVVYCADISADDLEKFFIDYEYPADFNLETLVKEIDERIKNHPELKDTTLIEKKKKIYSLIARISLCVPILIYGSIGLYCVITENSVKGNMWWGIMFVVIPLIVWFVFDVQSKRLK